LLRLPFPRASIGCLASFRSSTYPSQTRRGQNVPSGERKGNSFLPALGEDRMDPRLLVTPPKRFAAASGQTRTVRQCKQGECRINWPGQAGRFYRNGPHREIMPRVRRFFKGTIH
jgi:hypothetical protein